MYLFDYMGFACSTRSNEEEVICRNSFSCLECCHSIFTPLKIELDNSMLIRIQWLIGLVILFVCQQFFVCFSCVLFTYFCVHCVCMGIFMYHILKCFILINSALFILPFQLWDFVVYWALVNLKDVPELHVVDVVQPHQFLLHGGWIVWHAFQFVGG